MSHRRALRFHWSMSSAGESLKGAKARSEVSGVPDFEAHLEYCRQAEACGIESLLTAFGFHRPDPLVLAAALGLETESVKFLVACRPGVGSPTVFVQQVNTLSALIDGRVAINLVAGHTPREHGFYGDFLEHDERYRRADEFLTVCRAFWESDSPVNFSGRYYEVENGHLNTAFVSPTRRAPEIFLGGKSGVALELARKHASCLLTLPEAPDVMAPRIAPLVESGTDVGLLVSILARPTREEAEAAARALIASLGERPRKTHASFSASSDSEAFTSTLALAESSADEWLTPWLWVGAVPYLGAPAIAIVGSYQDAAQAIGAYHDVGVNQFLFMGWPDVEEMERFHHGVVPLLEARRVAEAVA